MSGWTRFHVISNETGELLRPGPSFTIADLLIVSCKTVIMSKTINVNESSIVDLKAELFRKEEKFKQDQTSSLAWGLEKSQSKGNKTLEKLAALTGKKKNLTNRAKDDAISCERPEVINNEDVAQYEKAKLMLEAKAKLYEKMSSGEVEDPEDDDEPFYLVDFHKKVYGKEVMGCSHEGFSPNDEWVEFIDSLGRTRKCLKKDLEMYKTLDQDLRPKERSPSPTALSSEDIRREEMRKKWEAEQEELSRNLDRDIHYQNVLFDEVRDHGVAYYQFSKDESERKSQMDTLNQLRQQTVEQRAKREQIKVKRQAVLNARLAKIKQKKLMRQGVDSHRSSNILSEITGGADCAATDHELLSAEGRTDERRDERNDKRQDERNDKRKDERNDKRKEEVIVELRESTSFDVAAVGSNRKCELVLENMDIRSQTSSSTNQHSYYQGKGISETYRNRLEKPCDSKSSYSQWMKALRDERNEEFAPPSFYYDTVPKKQRKNDQTPQGNNLF